MRDRLIELIREAKKHTKNANCDIGRNMIFADYLLANGVIVPPCKVGDTIYKTSLLDEVVELKAMRFVNVIITEPYNSCVYDDFGKTVFLTREEAEQALVTDKNVGSNEKGGAEE